MPTAASSSRTSSGPWAWRRIAQIRSGGLLLVKASNEGRTLFELAPKEKITQDFIELADRLLGLERVEVPKQQVNLFRRAVTARA